jgi:integrase
MKKEKIDKINQAVLKAMSLLEKGDERVAYYGEADKRKLVVPNQTNIAFVVSMYKNNQHYYETVGYFPDMTNSEFDQVADDFIASVSNRRHKKLSTMKVKDFIDNEVIPFSKANHKDSDGFLQRLTPFAKKFGHLRLSDISRGDIQKYLNSTSINRSTSTLNKYLSAVSKLFSLAVGLEVIDKNPCRNIKYLPESPSRKRLLSDEEALAFLDEALNDENPVHGLCLALSATTGLRQGNVRSIELCWLNADYTVLSLPDSKSGKPIEHQLSPASTDIIKLALANSSDVHLFPSRVPGKFMSKPSKCIARIRKQVQQRTGISEHFYAHDLRKKLATKMLEITSNINTVRIAMSHADIKTTQIYTLSDNDDLRDANTKTSEALLGGNTILSLIKKPMEG